MLGRNFTGESMKMAAAFHLLDVFLRMLPPNTMARKRVVSIIRYVQKEIPVVAVNEQIESLKSNYHEPSLYDQDTVTVLENGLVIRTVGELLGHKDFKTTMIYTHVMNRPGLVVESLLDRL